MFKVSAFMTLYLLVASASTAQPGFSSQYSVGSLTYFTNPTYNGVEINERPETIQQWVTEVSTMLEMTASLAQVDFACVVASQTSCTSWLDYTTAGFNYGNWQFHSCSYAGWTWDNCYNRPSAIVLDNVVANEAVSWGRFKATYR